MRKKTRNCKTCKTPNKMHAEFCAGCGKGLRKGQERNCKICQRLFVPSPAARTGEYCSAICRQRGISRATAEKRGDKQRGRGSGKGYVKRGGRHEHRVVAEQKLGRPLQKGEIVHHDDEVKSNNNPGNLLVMTQAEHARLHKLKEHRAKHEHQV